MSEMIERVERAILAALDEQQLNSGSIATLDAARAAIEAMREPTKGMIDEGKYFRSSQDPRYIWQIMVDEALK